MKKIVLVCIMSLLTLTGCQSSKQGMRDSGFLRDYSVLKPDEAIQSDEGRLWTSPDWAPAMYSKFIIDPVQLWLPKDFDTDVPMEQIQALTIYFRNVLAKAMSERYQVVAAPGPGVLRVRSAITEIEASSPTADIITSVLPIGIVMSLGSEAGGGKPTGVGAAGVEVEFMDSMTGQSLAMYQGVRYGKKYDGSALDELGDAKGAFDDWAAAMKQYFDIFHDHVKGE